MSSSCSGNSGWLVSLESVDDLAFPPGDHCLTSRKENLLSDSGYRGSLGIDDLFQG